MTYRTIELHGRHAVGPHRVAIVDPDAFEALSRYRWKAKPNGGGNHVYAVRNTKIDGRNVTIRMHREVMGVAPGGTVVVDHLNGNALDNRRANLRVCSQGENARNGRVEFAELVCVDCGTKGQMVSRLAAISRARNAGWICPACRKARERMHYPTRPCRFCGKPFQPRSSRHVSCSGLCRERHRELKRVRANRKRSA